MEEYLDIFRLEEQATYLWDISRENQVTVSIRPHWDKMGEDDFLCKFNSIKRNIPVKSLSKHRLRFTKWTKQAN